jgi:uncharacterized protein (DUF2141 family)
MKTHAVRFLFALAAAGMGLTAAPKANAEPVVKITVAGVKAPQGFMMIALHNEQGWSAAPLARARIAVTGNAVTATLAVPAPGRYGIKVFHDTDGDGKMGTNMIGFPTEPFGFSNNAPVNFGPPDFSAAAFEVGPSGAAHIITLK